MSARPSVLLFDIDGTLITSGDASRRALSRALRERFGRADPLDFTMAGLTDPLIVARALAGAGLRGDAATIEQVLADYLRHLPEAVATADEYRVFDGVVDILRAVCARPERAAVGLGTGNIEPAAQIKLRRGGLDGHFAFGGFGSDHARRVEVLRTGLRRGAARLGIGVEACRAVVIGDTPRDVEAALELGAFCVGLGTGGHDPAELLARGAHAAFDDLTRPGALEALLDG